MKNLNLFVRKKDTKLQIASWYFIAIYLVISFLLFSCEKEEVNDNMSSAAEAFEPNDSWQEAANVSLDSVYAAEIDNTDDDDYYIFTTEHGAETYDVITFQFTNVDADLRVCMEVLDNNGQSQVSGCSSNAGANYTYNLTCPGGTYIIKVDGDDGFTAHTGKYSFKIFSKDTNDTYAPNHTMNAAAEVNMNTNLNGHILHPAEDDYYIFSNPKSDYWQKFNLAFTNATAEFRVHYEIYNANKEEITHGVSNNQGSDVSCNFSSKTETIYIKVDGDDGFTSTTGSYTMNLSVSDTNDSNEPDDTFENAREITSFPSGNITGTIVCEAANDNGGDYEFYKISVNAGKKVEFSIDPEASDTELHFNVYNENQSYVDGLDGGDGETLNYYLNNPGSENIVMFIELGAYPSENGNYTISFTETIAD